MVNSGPPFRCFANYSGYSIDQLLNARRHRSRRDVLLPVERCSDRARGTVLSYLSLDHLLLVSGCRYHGAAGHRVLAAARVLVPGRRAVRAVALSTSHHVRVART